MIKRVLGLLFATAAIAAVVPLGCRQVLGIQEVGSDQLTCDAYCDMVGQACVDTKLQYASRDACMALCPSFPVGTLQDATGNTLGCRLRMATNIANNDEGQCDAAGPGGAGTCGDDCTSFCQSALSVCPGDFKSLADCTNACTPLLACSPYHVVPGVTPDDGSVQCRLFHVTSAASDPTMHCPHVMGVGLCIAGVNGCPGADGG